MVEKKKKDWLSQDKKETFCLQRFMFTSIWFDTNQIEYYMFESFYLYCIWNICIYKSTESMGVLVNKVLLYSDFCWNVNNCLSIYMMHITVN